MDEFMAGPGDGIGFMEGGIDGEGTGGIIPGPIPIGMCMD